METDHAAEYVLLIQDDGGDYYVGRSAALYRDGAQVWAGDSNDEAESILRSVLGDRLTVRLVKNEWDRDTESYFTAHIDGDEGAVNVMNNFNDRKER